MRTTVERVGLARDTIRRGRVEESARAVNRSMPPRPPRPGSDPSWQAAERACTLRGVTLALDTLNAPQRAAVLHADGPLVVFAGAGSGKTRVITYRIAHLIGERGVPPWRILAVTFTNKAAGEMRERLAHLVPQGGRDVWVGTFHAICARILRKYADLAGVRKDFTIYDDADQRAMINRVLSDLKLDDKRYDPKKVAGLINRAKQEVISPEQMPSNDAYHEVVQRIYATYEDRMRAAGTLDFGDLLYRVVVAAEQSKPLRDELSTRFTNVMVDEFQDTNHVQLRLVKLVSEVTRNLTVVGDDDQAIYRWRGADRRNILDFQKSFPDAQLVKLEQNYRSTKRILRSAHAVVSRNVDREPKTLWTDNEEGGPVLVVKCGDERDEARLAAETAKELVRSGRSLTEMAIFYRIHAQSRVFEEALRASNVSYQVIGGVRFYDRAEVKDLLAYLRVVSNVDDDVSLLRIVNVPTRGIGKTSLDKVMEIAARHGASIWSAMNEAAQTNALGATSKKLASFLALLEKLRVRASSGEGPAGLARVVLEETNYEKSLKDDDTPEADARLENLRELIGSMEEFEQEAETPTLTAFLELVTLQTSADEAGSGDKLTLMTVHAAKGLEFPVVLVAGLEEQMFPYRGLDADDDPEELEEERRLAYVAFTRAREKLVLTWTPLRRVFGQPRMNSRSRFLDELPKADLRELSTGTPRAASFADRPSAGSSGSGYDGDRPWSHPQQGNAARSSAVRGRATGTASPSLASGDGFRASSYGGERPPPPSTAARGGSYVDRTEGDVAGEDGGFYIGMAVTHAKYGVGKVQSVHGGLPPKLTVAFPGWGVKQLVASYVQPA